MSWIEIYWRFKMRKRRFKKEVKYSLLAIMLITLVIHYTWYINDLSVRREEYSTLVKPVFEEPKTDSGQEINKMYLKEYRKVDVYFTNYHLGDGSSGTTTASGLRIYDFEVNDDGMYTFDGKVVIATANMTRLQRGIVEGYQSHELYEEFSIRLNENEYQAIVLDICGACYGVFDEQLQRYDIFTTSNVIGKEIGQVILKTDQ